MKTLMLTLAAVLIGLVIALPTFSGDARGGVIDTNVDDNSRSPGGLRLNTDQVIVAQPVRFDAIDVFIDTKGAALGAYQFELSAKAGDVKIVGLEGNAALPFQDPPYYDPQAMQRDRVIVAAFSTADAKSLPAGRVRIATIHVQSSADAPPKTSDYNVKLTAVAGADGAAIQATISISQGNGL